MLGLRFTRFGSQPLLGSLGLQMWTSYGGMKLV